MSLPDDNEVLLRVASTTSSSSLAATISHAVYDGKRVWLRAIGAGAVNQSVKALAIACGFVGSRGYSLSFRPSFETVKLADGSPTAINIRVIAER
ncbi:MULTISPECIES: stage V sporulation protein S [Nonomuraea]|uniref:stage V sporulation protein S n=1 Tax=Nonomuraea TaxID=83681 RepID=UPI0012FB8FD1|nr:stage V sporulation protein S [Nonomuraea typhae]